MQNQLFCAICGEKYNQNKLPRLLPKCGHTFCENCVMSLFISNKSHNIIVCKIDKIEMIVPNRSIEYLPTNKYLIEKLNLTNSKNQNISIKQREQDQILLLDNNTDNDNIKKNLENHSLLKQIYQNNFNENQLCPIHSKNCQIFCHQQKQKICTSCALFGEHKGHLFQSLSQLQQQIKKQYQLLNQIYLKEDLLEKNIWGEQSIESFYYSLNKKQQLMINQTNKKFAELILLINNQKEIFVRQIKNHFSQIQNKYTSEIENLCTKQGRYENWINISNEFFKLIKSKSDNIQQLMAFNPKKLIQQGKQIIEELGKINQNFEIQKNYLINCTKLRFDKQFQNFIRQYATIYINESKESNGKYKKFKSLYDDMLKSPIKFSQQSTYLSQQLLLDDNLNQKLIQKQSFNSSIIESNFNILTQKQSLSQLQKSTNNFSTIKTISTGNAEIKKTKISRENLKTQPDVSFNQSFRLQKIKNKKKLTKLKLPEKYQKVLEGIKNDQLEIIDFTNAELGDESVVQILDLMSQKVKCLKLIKNKLSDQGFIKMIPKLKNVSTINLAQNNLTDKSIQTIKQNLKNLTNLKNLVLTQNKIKERNVKSKIEEIKKSHIIISL